MIFANIFDGLNEFEIGLLDALQNALQSGFLDTVMPYVTKLGDGGIFAIICTALLLCFKKTRATGVAAAAALIAEFLIVDFALKPLFMRARPFAVNPSAALLVDPPSNFSFPSGHSASVFAFAVPIFQFYKKLGIPALVIAALVAFSRAYLYVHYPTDILAGIAVGALIGACSAAAVKRVFLKKLGGGNKKTPRKRTGKRSRAPVIVRKELP
ncbi:MAG: phosphatase PAP2 family protein [Clostridiales bacterium]|nr:phosphatase PAP2 family protein [Clostridiales bacterium]